MAKKSVFIMNNLKYLKVYR